MIKLMGSEKIEKCATQQKNSGALKKRELEGRVTIERLREGQRDGNEPHQLIEFQGNGGRHKGKCNQTSRKVRSATR